MALHTGEIRLRDAGNYFGPTIIRCARMRAIGHGGQTLISDATRDLVVDALPDGAELRDLGLHRLKDLGRAERIWQLVHPELAHEFPPLRSLGAMPTNLPAQVSSFVGREAEIASVRQAMREHRLVTLTGTGGCGKTRLALHAAADELDVHPDGVWCAELAAVGHGSDIAQTVAGVFGLREEFGRPLIDTLTEQLRDLDALLVVDNCEQVLDAAARMIESLLHACPRLRVLATSREPLGVAGEVAWRVPSLDSSTAVALFVERAQQARPGFVPDAEAWAAIGQIADRLDGIPLALELAAARVRMMHPTRIAAALDDRFRLLTGGSRTAMPRQQTLEASVAWSYELLDDDERVLARRLSVLHGFTLDAAEAVGCDDEADRFGVLDMLTRLVDKSVVQVDHERQLTPATGCSNRCASSSRPGSWSRARPTRFASDTSRTSSASPSSWRRGSRWATGRSASRVSRPITTTSTPRWSGATTARCNGRHVAIHDCADAVLGTARPSRQRRTLVRASAPRRDDDVAPTVERARALWGAAHVALYGDDFETMLVRAPEALAMAETVGDDWAAARVEHARLRGSAVRSRGGTRPSGAQHRARSGDRRRLGRRRRLEDDDGLVLRRPRRIGCNALARGAPARCQES